MSRFASRGHYAFELLFCHADRCPPVLHALIMFTLRLLGLFFVIRLRFISPPSMLAFFPPDACRHHACFARYYGRLRRYFIVY